MARLCGWTGEGWVKFIEPVQFLYSLYLSGSMSLVSQSVRYLVQHNRDSTWDGSGKSSACHNSSSPSSDPHADVEAEAARWLMYMNVAGIVPALFSTIYLGGLSNLVGRKLVLLLPLIGGFIRLFFFVVVISLNLSLSFLVLSSAVDGCFGMSCSMLMACFSYTSDITTHQRRSIRIVLLQVCSGLALIFSSLVTGFVIRAVGYAWMFVILLGILTVNFLYIVFVLQESLTNFPCSESSISFFSLEPFYHAFNVFRTRDGVGRRACVVVALVISFIVSFVQLGRSDSQVLYLFTFPFCFDSVWIGYYTAAFYTVVNATMMLSTWLLVRFIGDIGLVCVGTVFGIVYELVFGFANSTLMIFLAPVAGCAMILPISLLRAYISKTVDPVDVASAFACFAWLENISALVGGITQNAIFAATASWRKNLVFLFDAGLYGVAFFITVFFLVYLRRLRRRQDQPIINYDEENSESDPIFNPVS